MCRCYGHTNEIQINTNVCNSNVYRLDDEYEGRKVVSKIPNIIPTNLEYFFADFANAPFFRYIQSVCIKDKLKRVGP